MEEQKGVDQVVQEGKVFAILGYIGILCLLPILLKKDNAFALHHGKQALVIFIGEVLCGVLMIIPVIGWIFGPIISLVLVIFAIIGLIQAAMGNYWKAPVISEFAKKINI